MALPAHNLNKTDCTAKFCGSYHEPLHHLPDTIRQQVFDHPCYSERAHHFFARMHVAVAPACNIQCHYCNRKYDCANESRPGVVSELLTPEQAVKKVLAAAIAIPHLTVLGIAGPGDPLANPQRTFATLRRVSEQVPDLKLCLSTNGLLLPNYVDELVKYNIGHVTLTINCLDPDIGTHIYPWIFWNRQRIRGREAAAILIEQQQLGLSMLVERGVLVKVNSVLIPGVNDKHLQTVTKVIKAKGAFLHNIVPLIAQPEHGTYYGLTGQREPTPEELTALQDLGAGDMAMMRHCRQCRADAIGQLGEDRGAEFSLDKLDLTEVDYAAAMKRRKQVQAAIAKQLEKRQVGYEAKLRFVPNSKMPSTKLAQPMLIAVASKGNGFVNEHFGHASEFLIYEASPQGVRFIGHRKTESYCFGSEVCGDQETVLVNVIQLLADCEAILCAQIGLQPRQTLESVGLLPNSEHAMEPIETAVMAVYSDRLKMNPDHV
jgi:nitrogen fixation protein NifB